MNIIYVFHLSEQVKKRLSSDIVLLSKCVELNKVIIRNVKYEIIGRH